MKQLTLLDAQAQAIATLKARQQAIALHYIQVSIDRDKLETDAIAQLKAKNPKED